MKLRPLFFALLLILPLMKALPADPPPGKKDRSHGLMQTVWSGADSFLKEYYSEEPETSEKRTGRQFKSDYPTL